jgi:hypothetical protein
MENPDLIGLASRRRRRYKKRRYKSWGPNGTRHPSSPAIWEDISAPATPSTIDFRYAKRNAEKAAEYCEWYRGQTLMGATEKAFH